MFYSQVWDREAPVGLPQGQQPPGPGEQAVFHPWRGKKEIPWTYCNAFFMELVRTPKAFLTWISFHGSEWQKIYAYYELLNYNLSVFIAIQKFEWQTIDTYYELFFNYNPWLP